MDLEYVIIIGGVVLVIVAILLLSFVLYHRNSRPVLIENFSNQELDADDREKWTRKHKFWTIFIIFYFVFLAVSLLHEYGIIR